ncbi:unnamed protein product [Lactuca virosa]|uniref:Uncharacterized protein n=1 Tax=Lactuca virosa TaxID=75947 RepID=A0AAU9NN96_9ASTR|nr:unnamed protein product [Lactuca virosa]
MGQQKRVSRHSKKHGKFRNNHGGHGVLESFHFEDSPRKDEDVHGVLISRETNSSSSSCTAVCVSNHSQKGNFFTNSPIISEIQPTANDVGEEVNSHAPAPVDLLVNVEATAASILDSGVGTKAGKPFEVLSHAPSEVPGTSFGSHANDIPKTLNPKP